MDFMMDWTGSAALWLKRDEENKRIYI